MRTKGRVVIPRNPGEMLDTAENIYQKHQADGASSPLNAMEFNKWQEVGPTIAACKAKHAEAEEFMKKADEAFAARDLLMGNITGAVKNSASLLKSIYSKNPKKLGDWGLTVHDSPQSKSSATIQP
jgi:hypothetical protein